LIQDPKIQRAAREIWYGPEEAASGSPGPAPSASSSSGANGGPERAEVTPEVTPEVTDSPESGVTLSDLDPIQGDGSDVTDYQEVERIATGQGVIKFGIATTETGPHRVTLTDGDEIIQYPAPEFMEWAEREGLYDRAEHEEKRKQEKLQEWYEKVQEWCESKKDQVLLTLILHEYHGESSVFDDMTDIAELLDTSHNYVRKVKSKHSGRATIDFGDEIGSIEVTL
jgi:predicted secreted protein